MKINQLSFLLLLLFVVSCTGTPGKRNNSEQEKANDEATTTYAATKKSDPKSDVPLISYHEYENEFYGYKVSYPDFLTPQGESDSHDGQTFKDETIRMMVYRDFRMLTGELDPIEKAFQDDLLEKQVTAKELHENYYRISGTNDEGERFTQHTLLVGEEYVTVLFFYPSGDEERMQPIIEKVSQSLSFKVK